MGKSSGLVTHMTGFDSRVRIYQGVAQWPRAGFGTRRTQVRFLPP